MTGATGHKTLESFPIRIAETVRFCDMDAYGHVNNAVYFRFFESARMAYLEKIDFCLDLAEPGAGPILAETRCRFRLPLTHPDTVDVGARITTLDRRWFEMEYCVVSREHDRVAAEGDARVVVYDYAARRKCELPSSVRLAIEALEKSR
jgi:acyl-CoA thioester hydrolase